MTDKAEHLQRQDRRAPTALLATASDRSVMNSAPAHRSERKSKNASGIATLAFAFSVVAILGYAWNVRAERHIAAGTGLGYWIGAAGSIIMLSLGLYPLRKKLKVMRRAGQVSTWFKSHMVLGIVGPTLIVLHSNFRLSAINNTVAMIAMLTVVASGLVARFLYAKVHHGLHGQKAGLSSLHRDAEAFRDVFGLDISHAPALIEELKAGERQIFKEAQTARESLKLAIQLRLAKRERHRVLMAEAQRLMAAEALRVRLPVAKFKAQVRAADGHLRDYQSALIKAAELGFYERLFSLWHLLHMPLFFLLIVTALVHVVAVHLY